MTNEHISDELVFSSLLTRALLDWPEVIDTHKLVSYHPGSYVIAGLGVQGDQIAESYIGQNDEVLLRNLQDAIRFTIRSAAQFLVEVRPAALRGSVVQAAFEEALLDAIKIPELRWTSEDIALVNQYFLANPKKEEPSATRVSIDDE